MRLYVNSYGLEFVVTLRLQFSFGFTLSDSISSIFHFVWNNNNKTSHSLTITNVAFSNGHALDFSIIGPAIMLAASEKLIKLLINRFCVKHKYELRRFHFLPTDSPRVPVSWKTQQSVLLFCSCRFHNKRLLRIRAYFLCVVLFLRYLFFGCVWKLSQNGS